MKNKYTWYLVDLAVFTIINIVLIWYMVQNITVRADLFDLFTPFKLVLFGLGVYRMADVISTENVTAGIRAFFVNEKNTVILPDSTEVTQIGLTQNVIKTSGFRAVIGDLISCPSCTGVWVAMILFYLYVFFPTIGTALLIIMALSAAERFLAKIYNLLEAWAKRRA